MSIDAHELQAWIDGELAPDDAARVAAAVARDAALASRASALHAQRDALRAAYAPVLDEPVPARLAALLQPQPGGIAATPVPAPPRAMRPRTRWQAPVYALAASLAAVAIALVWTSRGIVALDDGRLVARGELAHGLDRALASAPDARAAVAIGLTFRDAQGRICRSFAHAAEPAVAGLACRDAGHWTLPVLVRTTPQAAADLRQAAAALPPEVQTAVDTRLQGDVLDAAQERDARAGGWR